MSEDYIFRYRIDPPQRPAAKRVGALSEFARSQLLSLLDIITPCSGGAEVKVDGFKFLGPDDGVRGLYDSRHQSGRRPPGGGNGSGAGGEYQNMANAALYEPRIEYIARQLRDILSLVELESDGQPVEVDGFRLRNHADWADARLASPCDILLQASSQCNLNCVFCYNRGGLDSLRWGGNSPEEELREMETRLRYYNPRAGKGLFPTYGNPYELLVGPRALHILAKLRQKTAATFRLCTNGSKLDESFAARLGALAPIHLDVSLNSASPARRAMLMGDDNPETAIRSLALLREHGIPYAVTIVLWPLPSLAEALEDLAETVAYAADNLATLVQVNLPSFTKVLFPEPPFDTEIVWGSTVERVRELREHFECPIVIKPSLYEENLTRARKNLPEVTGAIMGSPAARCGLRHGDVIEMVNGIPVRNRAQARDMLTIMQENGRGDVTLRVRRNGHAVDLEMKPHDYAYPFAPETGTHLGAVFMGSGFRESYLERMRNILLARRPREALLLSSALIRPTLEQMLTENPLYVPAGTRLRIEVPENNAFAGNIILGDLLLVQDFIDFIQGYLDGVESVDLILIPSSPFYLGGWKRDLTGRPYLDIEREVGIPVSLMECDPIWD